MSKGSRPHTCSLRSLLKYSLSSWLFPVTLVIVVVADQGTKLWVRGSLIFGEQVSVINGFLNIVHTMNHGIAFGFLSGANHPYKTPILALGAVIAVVAFSWFAEYYGGRTRSVSLAVALLMGGTLGNLIDRLSYGGVVDFIDVHYKHTYHWPAFNIADAAVSFATLTILVRIAKHGFAEKGADDASQGPSEQVLQPTAERDFTEG